MHYARGLKGRCFGSAGILYRKCLWCGNLFRRIELAYTPPEIPIQQAPTKKLELGPGSDQVVRFGYGTPDKDIVADTSAQAADYM
jgi:hypothetical protein